MKTVSSEQGQAVAKEIMSQIKHTCKGFFPIYGCKNFISLTEERGGLQFDVRGNWKGRILITLNDMDEYTVRFGRVVKRGGSLEWKLDKTSERVQWSDFPEVLSFVENKGKSNAKLLTLG